MDVVEVRGVGDHAWDNDGDENNHVVSDEDNHGVGDEDDHGVSDEENHSVGDEGHGGNHDGDDDDDDQKPNKRRSLCTGAIDIILKKQRRDQCRDHRDNVKLVIIIFITAINGSSSFCHQKPTKNKVSGVLNNVGKEIRFFLWKIGRHFFLQNKM